jgi:hypothetical protein
VERHPIYLEVMADLKRSRVTVLFRLFLAIPHLIWISLWAVAVLFALVGQWFFTLFAGRPADPLYGFLARYLRYATHLNSYFFLLANPYPGFLGRPGYPVDLVIDPPARQSRWKTAFRVILAIPPYVFATVLGYVLQIVALAGWFVCLVLGRMPRGMRDLGAYCLRYQQQTFAYLLLLTDDYPTIASEPPREQAPSVPAPAPVA